MSIKSQDIFGTQIWLRNLLVDANILLIHE